MKTPIDTNSDLLGLIGVGGKKGKSPENDFPPDFITNLDPWFGLEMLEPRLLLSAVTEGLIALYTFDEGGGGTVYDVSENGSPLNLTISSQGNVSWSQGSLSIDSPTIVSSAGSSGKIVDVIRSSNEITLEAWISPENTTQNGPARIISLSEGPYERNFTLGQGLWGNKPSDLYNVRLRTTGNNLNGSKITLSSPDDSLTTDLQHVVFTRDSSGIARVYIDSQEVGSVYIGGDFSNWDAGFSFALGNEITEDRPWLGEFHRVAIYGQALSQQEIVGNYSAGPEAANTPQPNTPPTASDDSYEIDAGSVLNVNGVLGNDTDPDGDTLSAFLISDVANGALVFNNDGSFQYQPSENFSGIDSFTYQAADADSNSNIATVTITVNSVQTPERVTQGLVSSYNFDEGEGDTIYDVSGIGTAMNLTIADPANVNWINGGLSINAPTIVSSTGPADKLAEAVRSSNELTLEAWLRPDNTSQDGPARIVTISGSPYDRNFTLGQGLWGNKPSDLYNVRLRTTKNGSNGSKITLSSPEDSLTTNLQHVVFTRDSSGTARIYIDGREVSSRYFGGDLSNWDSNFIFALGNEITGDRPWLGEIHKVAVYSHALNASEVDQNYRSGVPEGDVTFQNVTSQGGQLLRVLGTQGPDSIVLNHSIDGLVLSGTSNSLNLGNNFASIEMLGFGGDDVIRVANSVTLPILIESGGGNDQIFHGGTGQAVIHAGDGDDLVVSIGSSADELFGEQGLDSFWADTADTISDSSAAELDGGAVHVVSEFYQPYTNDPLSPDYIPIEIAGQDLTDPNITGYASGYERFEEQLFVDAPALDDLDGREVKNTAFHTALSGLLANDASIISKMITPLGDGTFAVDFSSGDTEIVVRVDADIPLMNGSNSSTAAAGDNEIWVDVLEKAYAQLPGMSYFDASFIRPEAMDDLNNGIGVFKQAEANFDPDTYRTSTDGTVLGWSEIYILEAYLAMFEGTGDSAYLERLIEDIDIMLSNRDDRLGRMDEVRGRIMPAWSTDRTFWTPKEGMDGKRYAWIVHNGNIVNNIARWVYLVKRDPLLDLRFGDKASEYLDAVKETVDGFDADWREGEVSGEGYYWSNYFDRPLPLNQQNAMGRAMLNIYLATGETRYLDRVEKMAIYFKNRLRIEGDHYLWNYWSSGGRVDDFGHGAINVDFAFRSYRAGIVFNVEDMQLFANTFNNSMVLNPDGTLQGFTQYIDGTGDVNHWQSWLWSRLGFEDYSVAVALRKYSDTLVHILPSALSVETAREMVFELPVSNLLVGQVS